MKKDQAFTILEMLAVVLIVSVLTAIGYSVFTNLKTRAQGLSSINQLKTIYSAVTAYAGDHNGRVPSVRNSGGSSADIISLFNEYIGTEDYVVELTSQQVSGFSQKALNKVPIFAYSWTSDMIVPIFGGQPVSASYLPMVIPYNQVQGQNFALFGDGRVGR